MSAPNVRPRPTPVKGDRAPQPAGESRELSNYRLGERIGQDELATIYRATHQTLDRPVEIHILRRSDWISSSRFQLAGRLSARLHHAGILPVIDAGHDDRYGDYLVLPRLDGRPLAEVLASGPVDALLALRIFTQIGNVLDYLHQEGVIHRDLRPENVMLTPQSTAYLTNFSLAAAADTPDLSSIEEADYLTPYSAPEQSLTSGAPSPSQDLYSFGALLYHLLSGDVPPGPGQPLRSLADRDAGLAGADRIIRRLMATDPAQRYSSAELAITALRQSLRKQIDDSTEDMDEARWEPTAEWLENPLESVLGDVLDSAFIAKSRARADTLHRTGAIHRLLDRWSRQGLLRRPALGQIVQPEQIVSYNIYLYELRAYYETRTPPQVREITAANVLPNPFTREPEVWEVPTAEVEPFAPVPPETIIIPGSQLVIPCTACNGATQVVCRACSGKGVIERTRKVKERDGTSRDEKFEENCPNCRGYGKQPCQKCEASGRLLQEKTFIWSRTAQVHTNEDDISGLHKQTIDAQAQQVYQGRIDPFEARWHQIAPLHELLEAGVKACGPNTRLITAELVIRGTPVTEVDYTHKKRSHTLSLIGFKDELRGDEVLFDTERIALYVVIALLVLSLLLVLYLRG